MAERRQMDQWDRTSMVVATLINVNLPEGESVDPATIPPLRGGGRVQKPGRTPLDTEPFDSLRSLMACPAWSAVGGRFFWTALSPAGRVEWP